MFVGVWLASIGVLQVRPPSVDSENAMLSKAPPLKRLSCQTTYRLPFAGSTAIIGMSSPARTVPPLLGSVMPLLSWIVFTVIGADHVAPWSVERMRTMLTLPLV